MASLLFSQAVLEQYKEVSETINSVNTKSKKRPRRSMKELMQESFFHGANWIGNNFIA
jgi:hypothetical protein